MSGIQRFIPADYLAKTILKPAESNQVGLSTFVVSNLFSECVKNAVIHAKNRNHPIQSRLLCGLFLITRPLELPLKIIWIAGCTFLTAPIASVLNANSYHNWIQSKTGWSSKASLALTLPSFPFIAFPAALVGSGVCFSYLLATALTHAAVLPVIEVVVGVCSPDALYDFYAYVDNDRPRSIIQHIVHRCFGGNKSYKERIQGYMPTHLRDNLADVFHIERESLINNRPIMAKDIDTKDHLIDALLGKGITMHFYTHTHPFFYDEIEHMYLTFDAYNLTTDEKTEIRCQFNLRTYQIATCNICPDWNNQRGHTKKINTALSQLFSGSNVDLKNAEGETVTWALNPTMKNRLLVQTTHTGGSDNSGFNDMEFTFQ